MHLTGCSSSFGEIQLNAQNTNTNINPAPSMETF